MHAGDNDNGVRIGTVENGIWEALEQEAPRITEEDRVTKRMRRDLAQPDIDRLEELFAQTGPLPLVPGKRFFDIRCGGWPKYQVHYID